jgi:hypothetical protein
MRILIFACARISAFFRQSFLKGQALSELIPRISQEIIIQNEKQLDSFYPEYMGWIKTKSHLTLLSL